MDTLKPPPNTSTAHQTGTTGGGALLTVSDDSHPSSSPPRSNSVDLSTLQRDIELLSLSSLDEGDETASGVMGVMDGGAVMGGGEDGEAAPTPAESVKTVRSRSHDPSQSPDHVLRRPSRIEHLSELFRLGCVDGV